MARSSAVVASKKLLRARPTLIRAMLASLMCDKPSNSLLYICPAMVSILPILKIPMPATTAPISATQKNAASKRVPTFIRFNMFSPVDWPILDATGAYWLEYKEKTQKKMLGLSPNNNSLICNNMQNGLPC